MKTQFSKIILTGLLMLILVGKAQSQTCTMSIGSRIKCPVDTVWVPVKFYAFDQPNVGSINIDSIQFPTDTNILVFRNQPGDCIPGALFANGWNSNYNAATQRFKISWSSATPVVADSGIICYLKCYYKSAAIATISFLQSNMYVTDETGSVSYNINFIDGTVSDGLSGITVSASPNPYCIGDIVTLHAGGSGATSWSWSGPCGFSSTAQNPVILTTCTGYLSSTIYTLIACNGCGCDTTQVSVLRGPPDSVYASVSPNPACIGTALNFSGNGIRVVNWIWTGPNGFTDSIQNPTLNNVNVANAGVYTLKVSNNCGYAVALTPIVVVGGPFVPSVFITASPTDSVIQGSMVVFTANAINGAFPAVFQWKLNGDSVGFNANTYSTNMLNSNDEVCCNMTVYTPCSGPVTVVACDTVQVISGIDMIDEKRFFISEISPNPVNENSAIRLGLKKPTGMQMQVFDITGRQLSNTQLELSTGEHDIIIDNQKLASGVYRLVLQMDNGSTVSRAFVK